jgi:hypothetical protein
MFLSRHIAAGFWLLLGGFGPGLTELQAGGHFLPYSFPKDEISLNPLMGSDLQGNAEKLMHRLTSRLSELRDLQATVHVQADVPRVKVRPLTAEMYFLAPDRFRLRSSRLALLPRQNPMELFEFLKMAGNYKALAMGFDKVRNQSCMMVNVLPLGGGKDWQLVRLWIHPETAQIHKAEMTRRNLGTVEVGYFYGIASAANSGTQDQHRDLPDSLLFELDASMMKLPKALTADLHRSQSQTAATPNRPLGAAEGKARVAMAFRWTSVNKGAAAKFFRAQKQD